jgi:hypothetical protein
MFRVVYRGWIDSLTHKQVINRNPKDPWPRSTPSEDLGEQLGDWTLDEDQYWGDLDHRWKNPLHATAVLAPDWKNYFYLWRDVLRGLDPEDLPDDIDFRDKCEAFGINARDKITFLLVWVMLLMSC